MAEQILVFAYRCGNWYRSEQIGVDFGLPLIFMPCLKNRLCKIGYMRVLTASAYKYIRQHQKLVILEINRLNAGFQCFCWVLEFVLKKGLDIL